VNKIVKKIGITTRIVNAQGYEEKRDALSQDWVKFLEIENIIPILIPNNLSDISSYLEEMNIDGVILSGGDNIGDNKDRDDTEKQIIQFGIEWKLPIFGVCRGMQVLNKFFKGKIRSAPNDEHVGKNHEIFISDEKISDCLKQNKIIVNSYHRNIINFKDIGESLISFAIHKKDNTIEGFIHKELPIIGVMWHPEREQNNTLLKKFLLNKILGI
jgi:N5-(cytidine 5'-diphosphoramidyl)-L-glutamine hydrolase